MKKNIFNFNHISSEITNAQYNEIKNLYKYYHKLYWCHKEAYKNFKCKSLSLIIISSTLVVSGTIIGGITLNPIILGTITGVGIIIAAFAKKKDYESKIKMSKYAFTLYEKILTMLRTYLRGESYDHAQFIHEMKLFDDIITDLAPLVDKYMKLYDKKFTSE